MDVNYTHGERESMYHHCYSNLAQHVCNIAVNWLPVCWFNDDTNDDDTDDLKQLQFIILVCLVLLLYLNLNFLSACVTSHTQCPPYEPHTHTHTQTQSSISRFSLYECDNVACDTVMTTQVTSSIHIHCRFSWSTYDTKYPLIIRSEWIARYLICTQFHFLWEGQKLTSLFSFPLSSPRISHLCVCVNVEGKKVGRHSNAVR